MLRTLYHVIFDVSKEMSEVNVEEISRSSDHNVVVMTITNTL